MLVVQISLGEGTCFVQSGLEMHWSKRTMHKYSSIFLSNYRKQLLEETELESILVFNNFLGGYRAKTVPMKTVKH